MRVLILVIELSKFEDVVGEKESKFGGKSYSKIIRSVNFQKDREELSKWSNRVYFLSDEIW